jgi:hypothetical protein
MAGILSKYHKPQKNQGGDFRPWLNKEEVPETGIVATVDELREAPAKMANVDMLLDVTIGRKEYTLSLYAASVLLTQLVTVLGDNEKRWKGQRVKFYLAKGKFINAAGPNEKVGEKKVTRKSAPKKRRK